MFETKHFANIFLLTKKSGIELQIENNDGILHEAVYFYREEMKNRYEIKIGEIFFPPMYDLDEF